MSKHLTRRNLLKLLGGSTLGVMMTPLPWKLVDDSAIWTQNWSLIPALPRGRERFVFSACTLCPGGCPLKARMIGGTPVGLRAAAAGTAGTHSLCPVGLAGHHLAFHQSRIFRPWRRVRAEEGTAWRPAGEEEILEDLRRRLRFSGMPRDLGILDRRPGRSVSLAYREFLNRCGRGVYITSHHSEEGGLVRVRKQMSPDPGPLGYDLEHSAVILSFCAPLMDGWGSPGRVREIFTRPAGTPRLIQVEHRQSRTARRADLWVPARPGTEGDLALGIGRMILADDLCPPAIRHSIPDLEMYSHWIAPYTPEYVHSQTGIEPGLLCNVVHALTGNGQPVVIDGSDPAAGPSDRRTREAIAALNVLLGSPNRRGGILPRNPVEDAGSISEESMELSEIPEGSLGLLILDDADSGLALRAESIRRTVDPASGLVVAFSPYLAGLALAADIVIPVPAPYESVADVYRPPTDPRSAMGLSAPLLAPRIMAETRDSFLEKTGRLYGVVGDSLPASAHFLDRRIGRVSESGRGALVLAGTSGEEAGRKVPAAAELRVAMMEGAWWTSGDARPHRHVVTTLLPGGTHPPGNIGQQNNRADSRGLLLIPAGWRGTVGRSAVPSLASKIYQESELRLPDGHVSVNPSTAASAGVSDGERGRIVTGRGSVQVVVHCEECVMPGVVELACGPLAAQAGALTDPLSLCETATDGTWRITPVVLEAL